MSSINIAAAKAQFSDLVARAEAGEETVITRHGKEVARVVPPKPARKKLDVEALRRLTEGMPYQEESAGEFMRRLRDQERY
jgi:prevent-host-death family protein